LRPIPRNPGFPAGATRSHPKSKQAYLDLRAAGKPAKLALVAIARRLVTLANALIRDNIPFNNDALA
jgi:transposase